MNKLAIICAGIVAASAATAATAQAQYAATRDIGVAGEEQYYQHGLLDPVSFNIGGALSMPVSNSGSRFDPGTGFAAGVTFMPPRSPVGIQAEYMFSWFNVDSNVLEGSGFDGNQVMHSGTLDLIVQPPQQRRFGFYLAGGGGIYSREVEITEFAGVGVAPYCDPYLFACYAAPVAVSDVVGSRDSFDFGVNGGLGVYAMLTPPLRVYLEARFHYIWGPEFTAAEGERVDSDGQYVPVVLGLAF